MKKQFLTLTLACTIGFSTIAYTPPVEAATVQQINTKADQLIRTAKSLIGKATYSNATYKDTAPYKFSCATFLMYIFEQNGVDLGTYNEDYMMKQGTHVAKANLQKGDLVFFKSKKTGTDPDHVGLYIGNNKIIHMADAKQNIVISDLNSKPYYRDNYLTARRVLPTLMPATPQTTGDRIVERAYANKALAASRYKGARFTDYIYRQSGITLGTTLAGQMQRGQTVTKANLRKGDLVFFNSVKGSKTPTLVAIYGGNHRLLIPTASGFMTRVLLADYYKEHFITAKRVTK